MQVLDNRERVLEGIRRNAEIVGSTMGPWGRNVTIDLGGGMVTVKDGVTVSRMMNFDDVWEKMGSQIVASACRRTVEEAGDGTTATAVMTGKLSEGVWRYGIEEEFRKLLVEIEERVRGMSMSVVEGGVIDGEKIRSVARIASNGREDLAEMIGGMVERMGIYGEITVESGEKLEGEVLEGYVWECSGEEFEVEDPMVLLVNQELDRWVDLRGVMKVYTELSKRRPLVIVTNAVGQVRATLLRQLMAFREGKSDIEVYMVSLPGFGESRHEMMGDLGAICGCVVYNHLRGVELKDFGRHNVGGKSFGRCDRVRVRRGKCYVFGSVPEGLVEQAEGRRKAMLTGGIGIIRVGGKTDIENANDREIVDDAIRACYSALDGVVPGGGRCLEQIGRQMGLDWLLEPKRRIWENAGLEMPEEGMGWRGQLIGGEDVDFRLAGILDPAKVVMASVRNAVSAAVQFLSTKWFMSVR